MSWMFVLLFIPIYGNTSFDGLSLYSGGQPCSIFLFKEEAACTEYIRITNNADTYRKQKVILEFNRKLKVNI